MKSNVIDEIVKNDLCIGCGVCVGICPQKSLIIQESECGEYAAYKIQDCTLECGLCLKVCPFADTEENEDTIGYKFYRHSTEIMHTSETGYYLTSYVGYSEKYRLTSASGGIATWILENLLTERIADHVICVSPVDDPEKLFAFKVFDTADNVREGAGSAYYPVEMSEVINYILSTPGRYAITGLPCFIKAIRCAQQINKKLRERIIVTLGLTCGQLKSKHYTTYLASLSGIQNPIWVRYHQKLPEKPAADYHFVCKDSSSQIGKRIFISTGMGEAWLNRWFTYNACNYCDDVFAECADVNCMDAWLPEYWNEPEGNNLVIIRSQLINQLIRKGIQNNQLHLKEIPINQVIRSQKEVIYHKRTLLPYRIKYNLKYNDKKVPTKRFNAKKANNPLRRDFTKLQMEMQKESTKISRSIHSNKDVSAVQVKEIMEPYLKKSVRINRIQTVISLPKRIINKILKSRLH
ncbi:4Fe-4S ferredoxin [Methanosarcina sp. DH1]|uniref:Coenzyme F420 hydrogenase/dehydrogenase, beta subunit C-terminal domain n=1 Tax=Methanosarcina sp. DH1 TaxID=2605695 RepID=UPI001E455EE6|nr:Coenzyme F420 hydrogenase/dehydrogenase, beta subunit C-terminal domain [Methanosarcina sp. DH1]MCC4765386.1 4Fe-4S ferredoxin [Methanosarcina sp. DH1]